MRIGIDFDNTIVCFDPLFYREALSENLIPPDISPTKLGVRDYLRAEGKENDWTELQGFVYGELISEAEPFVGVKDFFQQARMRGHHVSIISHKTKQPALGYPFDLQKSARAWLEAQGFFTTLGLDRQHAFFETSIPLKIERIQKEQCDIFIDDLVEFLINPDFPQRVERIHFSPNREEARIPFKRAESWNQIQSLIL